MALQTKTFTSAATANGYTLRLTLTENSVSAADNTSSVTWRLTLVSGGWRFSQYRVGWSVSLNGAVASSKSKASAPQLSMEKNSELTIASGTKNVPHGADGTLNMAASASIDTDVTDHTPGPLSLSGSMALTAIPRASTLTVSDGALGTAQTVTITRAGTSFTHTIAYVCGSHSGNFNMSAFSGSGSTLTRSWTPKLEWADANTTGQTVSVTLTLTTLNGGTTVGTETRTVSMAIPASVKPSCSAAVALVNDNATVAGWGVAVKGFSKYKVTASFTGSYGSTLKSRSVKVSATGQTLTASPATSAVLTSTSRTVKVTVTDSRGRQSDTVTVSGPTIYDHGDPTISAASAFRCGSDGTADESGTYLSVRCKGSVSSCGGHNAASISCRRKVSGGSWTSWTALTNDTVRVLNAGLDASKSCQVQFRVTDSLGAERTVTVTVPSAAVTLHLRAGGSGAAFGGYAQRDSAVDFTDWDVLGRVLGLGLCPDIPSGADLNGYTTPGVFSANNATAASLLNGPSAQGGRLTVFSALGRRYTDASSNIYLRQLYETWRGEVYQRRGDSSTGLSGLVWGGWALVCGVDAVTEEGTGSGWSWRKWARGQCELWCTRAVTASSSTVTSSGAGYYSNALSVSLPFPVTGAAVTGSADRKCVVTDPAVSSDGNSVSFYLMRFTAVPTTASVTVSLHVRGRWQ